MHQKWLIVEDNSFDAESIERAIHKAFPSVSVKVAYEFEIALEHFTEAQDAFGLIISDYNLPGITGLEGCKQLRQDGVEIPMILMTGNGCEQTAVAALKGGIDDYIVKDMMGGYLPLLVTVIEDVLQRHADRVERQMAQRGIELFAKELEIKNKELDAFAHTVAHDLRNPLSMIKTYLSLLKSDLTQDALDAAPIYLEKSIEITDKSIEIVNALLTFALMKDEELVLEPVSIIDTVNNALTRLQLKIRESQAELLVGEDWPVCIGHAPWIEEVWVNLISNAIKYGGQPPRIHIGCKMIDDQTATLFVTDNGQGLSDQQRAIIFEPLTRLTRHKDARIEGTGLGLSIVSRIIDRIGGTVDVKSTIGVGSTFSFTLPLIQSATIDTAPLAIDDVGIYLNDTEVDIPKA